MPFNGSGGFTAPSAPDYPPVAGEVIYAARFKTVIDDIHSGLGSVLCRDGQSNPTANLPMNNFKHTGAAAASAAGHYLVYGQQLANAATFYVSGASTTHSAEGAYLEWNKSAGGGETCFVNQKGSGVGGFRWYETTTGNTLTERMRIDDKGNLSLGQSTIFDYGSGYKTLELLGGTNGSVFRSENGDSTRVTHFGTDGVGGFFGTYTNHALMFVTNNAEKARFTNAGSFLIGTTSNAANFKSIYSYDGAATNGMQLVDTSAGGTPNALAISYANKAPNNTGPVIVFSDTGAIRFELRNNGGIANFSANNVNLSDQSVKKDIQQAADYLSKICSIPVRTFQYKDQTDPRRVLGVIAQEVDAVAPELVDKGGLNGLLSIYQTDFQFALMRAIQELAGRVLALEGS